MPEHDTRPTGAWKKAASPACAAKYPAQLRFDANGLYFGTTEPAGEFTWWDGGTWKVTAPGRLALSTANDAVIEYQYVIENDTFSVTDPSGCSVRYQRVS